MRQSFSHKATEIERERAINRDIYVECVEEPVHKSLLAAIVRRHLLVLGQQRCEEVAMKFKEEKNKSEV